MLLQLFAQFADLLMYVALIALHPAAYQLLYSSPQTAPTPTPPVQVSVPASSNWDPVITAAIISAVAALFAAFIAVVVAIYQTRQT